ncbi:MAG: M56 family metallopeptidase [Muribaculaceae bacterium]|nr:M56 family metallopeptidase [Muribaculaceae bacterium]MDE6027077.1 M56 family metallopeptidase [Muribaculaceae bacterium]
MGALFAYSIMSGIILFCGYMVYKWIFSAECQHGYNRVLIYSIYIMALVLPAVVAMISVPGSVGPGGHGGIEIGELSGLGMIAEKSRVNEGFNIYRVLLAVYSIGIVVMALYSAAAGIRLHGIVKRGERMPQEGFTLVITEEKGLAPFSWMNYMVMNREDYERSGEVIMIHEESHLKLRHWADLLLSQLIIIFQWYNPAAWLLREEFKTVHEYQADEAVLKSGTNMRDYQMLLIKKAVGTRFQSLANSLNHSKLKKRITMMYKENRSGGRQWAALLLVPAMALGCVLVKVPAFAGFLKSESEATLFLKSGSKVNESSGYAPVAEEKESSEKVYQSVDACAEPVGGMKNLLSFLKENIVYPEKAEKEGIEGRVIVRFVVEKDGSIGDPTIVKGVDKDLDKEAIRIVGEMPKWTPAKVDGKPVASYYTLPVSFRLPDDNENQKGE